MNKVIRNRQKKQPIVNVEMNGKGLTINSGLLPVFNFLDRLRFRQKVSSVVNVRRGANAKYHFVDVVEMLVTGFIAGAHALEHVSSIWHDKVLRKFSNSSDAADATTLGRILRLATAGNITELEGLVPRFRGRVWKSAVRSGQRLLSAHSVMWLDVDSTVSGVCGNQEGAQKGYNPKKKGQKSYHPLMAFVAETKEVFHSWFRCGSAYSSNGVVEFMRECMSHVNKRVRVVFRGDSAFFREDLLDYLDSVGAGYLIKVKLKNLGTLLFQQSWRQVSGHEGYDEATFILKCGSWSTSRKCVAIRQLVRIERGLIDVPVYDYFCYVTTESLSPMETHATYGQRATCETWIEEFKGQINGCGIRTSNFLANAAIFQSAILSYNILKWMALLTNQTIRRWEIKSIRFWLIRVAGKLITSGRQLRLLLPKSFLHQKEWLEWERMSRSVIL
jgi:hypothetical protein